MWCGQGTAPIQLKWPCFVNNGEGKMAEWMGLTLADEDIPNSENVCVKPPKQRETPNRDYQVYEENSLMGLSS